MRSSETRESLLKKIQERRYTIRWFIDSLEPTGRRLTNFNIICGAVATVLTATPAIGGRALIDAFSVSDSVTWRILFAIAALFSLLSTIAANLYRANDIASNLSKAQGCDAKLEGLEALVEYGQVPVEEAAARYAQYLSEIPFVSGILRRSALDWVKGEIERPAQGDSVQKTIHCSGWAEGTGPGCHLWLAVESDKYTWPKEREIFVDSDGSWNETIYEEGNLGSFSLSLYAANDKANRRIRAWLDAGDRTGIYKEMRRPSGTRRIARVDELRPIASSVSV